MMTNFGGEKRLVLAALILAIWKLQTLGTLSRSGFYPTFVVEPRLSHTAIRVVVVIVMDPSEMVNDDGRKGQSTLLMAWNCYCLKHGYGLLYSPKVPVNEDIVVSNRANQNEFYQGRLKICQNYLQFTDILVLVDSDSLVIDHEKKITDFISNPDDHVVLQQRQNKAICAGSVIIRNSPQGQTWLDSWYEDSTPHIDMDNGRLHSQVLRHYLNSSSGLSQATAQELLVADKSARHDMQAYFRLFNLMGDHVGYSYHVVRFGGIVIYPAFGGFFRDFGFEAQPGVQFWNEVPFNCILETDFIIHTKSSGPLVLKEDWACSKKNDILFGSTFPLCNISSRLWYQCQMTRQDRAGLFGSHICQESEHGPCTTNSTNLDEWKRSCSSILELEGRSND